MPIKQNKPKQNKLQDILEKIDEMKHKGNCTELGCKMTYNQALEDIKKTLK